MTADIFFGVIHYQRLRHMVSDKFQVKISSKCQIDKIRAKPFDRNGGRKGGGTLCVEMGFTWTFSRNQDATVKLKSELISIKFW